MSEINASFDDFSELLGAGELQMVGFGLYTVVLHFQSGLRIVIYHNCAVKCGDGSSSSWDAQTDIGNGDTKMFTKLLGSDILSYKIAGTSELILTFTNRCELSLIADPAFVECFIIWFASGGCMVV
jgi:hypothetical protein